MRAARLDARYRALATRLRADPGVLDVTYASSLPLMRVGANTIALDAGPAAPRSVKFCPQGYCAAFVRVDPRFFDAVRAPALRGRSLTATDADDRTRSVLVNEFFVNHVLGGHDPIGRRLRVWSTRQPTSDSWYRIVGVVPDLGVSENPGDLGRARIFLARRPEDTGLLRIAIHVRGDPQAFVPRLRALAQAVDPALRVIDPKPLPRLSDADIDFSAFWYHLLISLTVITLVLSLAGVYAATAFAVARRTREIGVRVALGAQRTDILIAVFKRPFVQIALGIGAGAITALVLVHQGVSDLRLEDAERTAAFVVSASVCCALGCVVPTWRALRVQPTEALKDEG